MVEPAVLPSGHSAEKSVVKRLIASKSKDPLDPSKSCKDLLNNYLAKHIIEIVNTFKVKDLETHGKPNNSVSRDKLIE